MTTHVQTLNPGMWAPGKDVVIRDGILDCSLDTTHAYPFVEESGGFLESAFHSKKPHLEFLQVTNEQGLLRFVKRWGPILLTDRARGKSVLRVTRYWLTHRYLRSVVHLLSVFHRSSGEAEGLGQFLELRGDHLIHLVASAGIQSLNIPEDAEYLKWLNGLFDAVDRLPRKTDWIGTRFGAVGQITGLLESSPPSHVRRLMDLTISNCFTVATVPQPRRPKRLGERPTIVPRLKADELQEALEYLIFLDEWKDHPLHQCDDCGRLFRSDTRHPRRYCSPECARRVSSREYKRSIRAKQKRDFTRGETQ